MAGAIASCHNDLLPGQVPPAPLILVRTLLFAGAVLLAAAALYALHAGVLAVGVLVAGLLGMVVYHAFNIF